MTHRIKVLLVEDNQADVELMTETMEMSKILCDLAVVNDGEQALKYLRREGDEYANASRPDLIFLDLNLPMVSGYEVLEVIKNDEIGEGKKYKTSYMAAKALGIIKRSPSLELKGVENVARKIRAKMGKDYAIKLSKELLK